MGSAANKIAGYESYCFFFFFSGFEGHLGIGSVHTHLELTLARLRIDQHTQLTITSLIVSRLQPCMSWIFSGRCKVVSH